MAASPSTSTSRTLRAATGSARLGSSGARDPRIERHLAIGGRADRGDQLIRLAVLEQVADRTGGQHVANAAVVGERGQGDDRQARTALRDLTGCGNAVKDGHRDVHQDDIGTKPQYRVDRLNAVGRFADHSEIVGGVDQPGDPGADQRVIVNHQNPGHDTETSIR